MPSPPLVGVPDSDPIGRGQEVRLITPSAPVAVKRVDAVVHVEPCTNKCCTGETVLLFEIGVGDGHTITPEMNCAGRELKYTYSRRFHFQEGLAGRLIRRRSTGSSMMRGFERLSNSTRLSQTKPLNYPD